LKPVKSDKLVTVFTANKALVGVVALCCIAGSAYTVTRNKAWKNHFIIYSTDVKHAPGSARLHYWHANEIMKEKALKAQNKEERIKYLDAAIAEYNTALQIHPQYADAFGQRGLAYFRKEEYDKAIADYKAAINLNVGQWKVYNNLGVIYSNQKNYPEAIKNFNYALQVDHHFPDPYLNLAKTYIMMRDYENAIANCFKTLEFATQEQLAMKLEARSCLAQAYVNVGRKSLSMHDYQDAIANCLKTLEYSTENDTLFERAAYKNLSLAYGYLGDTGNQQKYAEMVR
jgi:tetratricopeptide (TPR) repeat protein